MARGQFASEDKLTMLSFLLGFAFLSAGGLLGLLQLITRTPYFPKLLEPSLYYLSMTTHGIVNVIVWTTYFIFGLVIFVLTRNLETKLHSLRLAWWSLILITIGVLMAALMLLTGNATVGWTFYAPLKANPLFYLGLVVLILGTWVFAAEVLLTVRKWMKQGNEGKRLPLAVFGVVAVLIIWLLATPAIAIEQLFLRIPWSLGIAPKIDVMLSRTLFWWFGHPVVYFWLIPAIIIWYTVLPQVLGVKLYSDEMGRIAFILFILFSANVGLHHQFLDPGIPAAYKFLQTALTYLVGLPSLLTVFNVTATLEMGARRNGGEGLIGWVRKLPWSNPVFVALASSLLLFGFGGITGFVNAGYAMNLLVHNTAWVVGHFHMTVGSGVTLAFMGASYLIVPLLSRRELYSRRMAVAQAWLWLVGAFMFGLGMSMAGIGGSPRRTYDVTYAGHPSAAAWAVPLHVSALGGFLIFISGALFILNMLLTLRYGRFHDPPTASEHMGSQTLPKASLIDSFKLWTAVAIVILVLAYAPVLLSLKPSPVAGASP